LSSDISPSYPASLSALLEGYRSRNISVGAIDIDSGWSTGYNNFIPDSSTFPSWPSFVSGIKAEYGVRVILWMTSMINHESSNFNEALSRKFFVLDGFNEPAVNLSWWHGTGGLLDYSSPTAREWWGSQMAPLLSGNGTPGTGIDGWKCDGTVRLLRVLLLGCSGCPQERVQHTTLPNT